MGQMRVQIPSRSIHNMQSKLGSTAEALVNLIVGYPLTFVAYVWLAPALLGVRVTPSQSMGLVVLFTAISFLRQYTLRRIFIMIESRSKNASSIDIKHSAH